MGWLYGWNSRKELVTHLVDEPQSYKTLAHATTRENGQSILWAVHEFPMDSPSETYRGKKFIACYLMDSDKGMHGYKDMEESMGPYFYSCPLAYLDMVPEVTNQEWRDGVKARVEAETKRKKFMKLVAVGNIVQLPASYKPNKFRVVSLMPLLGEANGTTYRIPKNKIEAVA